ncbi:hypothetical protein ACFL5Q_04590 [Planctomycetota bacterium]
MIRCCWFVLVGFLLVQWPATAARAENAGRSPKPNILFIMADDHAAHSVSAYGHPHPGARDEFRCVRRSSRPRHETAIRERAEVKSTYAPKAAFPRRVGRPDEWQ